MSAGKNLHLEIKGGASLSLPKGEASMIALNHVIY